MVNTGTVQALDTPLVLHDCIYDRLDFQWLPENLWRVQVSDMFNCLNSHIGIAIC
jgi:hypothetical protein